jgi:hypothetical protein
MKRYVDHYLSYSECQGLVRYTIQSVAPMARPMATAALWSAQRSKLLATRSALATRHPLHRAALLRTPLVFVAAVASRSPPV